MPTTLSRPPKYCLQKQAGRPDRAYVKIGGKRIMLGNYGTPESYERYSQAIAGNVTKGAGSEAKPAPATPTMAMLMAAYLEYAIEKYGGDKAVEVVHLKGMMRVVKTSYADVLARDFSPKLLRATQRRMVAEDWSRGYINEQTQRIRRMADWGVIEEIVPPTVAHALKAVPGLEEGDFGARETEPRRPVPQDRIDATLKELSEPVRDLVQLQLLTGARPGELLQLSIEHLDRSGEIWLFSPPQHKNKRRGKSRVIAIGPRAQAILTRYLFSSPCFNYSIAGYRRAVTRACIRAFKHPTLEGRWKLTVSQKKELAAWRLKNRWSPYQLRHNCATNLRNELGIEHAQATLGHAKADMTEHYAQVNIERAVEAAKKLG